MRTFNQFLSPTVFLALVLLGGCPSSTDNLGFDSGTPSNISGTDTGFTEGDSVANLDGKTVIQHAFVPSEAACLDYPDVGHRVFPYNPALAMGQTWPTCTLNCKTIMAQAGTIAAPLDQSLPAGACSDEGATCDSPLMAGWCGPCADTGGPGHGYTCLCRGGAWHCALRSPGLNTCTPNTCIASSTTPQCNSVTWTETEVCACDTCKKRCSSDDQCPTGKCKRNTICQRVETCPGPDECLATCTGICEPQ